MRSPKKAGEALKILIVEDEVLAALDLESELENLGEQVVGIAGDAEQAFALAKVEAADLALVDLNLRDGLTGPQIARELSEERSVPAVFVTGSPSQIPRDFAGALGAITKPWESATIKQLLAFVRAYRKDHDSLSADRVPSAMMLSPALKAWLR